MLPSAARLTRSQDFSTVVRRGRRAGRPRVVVHVLAVLRRDDGTSSTAEEAMAEGQRSTPTRAGSARVGFVVSKAVGDAVVRHRVSRRLRHVFRARLAALPPGTDVVVRALPPAAESTSEQLAADVDRALRRLGIDPTADAQAGRRAENDQQQAGGM
ncbi:ribonuclease P protein component [Actinoalloteichus hoggarensis]|nr:ribonuclease P protein component [Actinoalloteichus hoggarensis]MBB5922803.1 ribonuclease P protein component [Actinoalloteichus hoggarensis]